jgi:AcrR family transcriptional regulator
MASATKQEDPADARPLRSDASRNQARVLEAARELLAERGLDVTMDEIARRAGVGVGTAYRRFGSRDELLDALFEERTRAYIDLAEEALALPDPWDGLATFLERSAELQARDRGLHDLLCGDQRMAERVRAIRETILPLVERVVERAVATGDVRGDLEARDVPMLGLMLSQVVEIGRDVAPDLWRRYLTLLLDGVRTRRDAPSELAEPALTPDQLDAAMAPSPCSGAS